MERIRKITKEFEKKIEHKEEHLILKTLADPTRYHILQTLHHKKEPLTIYQIANILGKTTESIRKHVKILQEAKLIVRVGETEKGAHKYMLTPKGERVYRAINTILMSQAPTITSAKEYPEITIEVKPRRQIISKIKKIIPIIPETTLIIIGFLGLLAPAKVSIISRILWLMIFLALAILVHTLIRRIMETFRKIKH